MLDDLHEIRSSDCQDALSVVIAGMPPGSQFVAASRSEQPHLPRLRASGDTFEVLARDLALDVAGAAQIFSLRTSRRRKRRWPRSSREPKAGRSASTWPR